MNCPRCQYSFDGLERLICPECGCDPVLFLQQQALSHRRHHLIMLAFLGTMMLLATAVAALTTPMEFGHLPIVLFILLSVYLAAIVPSAYILAVTVLVVITTIPIFVLSMGMFADPRVALSLIAIGFGYAAISGIAGWLLKIAARRAAAALGVSKP